MGADLQQRLPVAKVEQDRQKVRFLFMRLVPKHLLYFGTHKGRHDPRDFLCECWSTPVAVATSQNASLDEDGGARTDGPDTQEYSYVPYKRCEEHDCIVDWPLPKFEPAVEGLPLDRLNLFPDIGEANKKQLNDKIQKKLDAYVSDPNDRDDPRKLKTRLQDTINRMFVEALKHPGETAQRAHDLAVEVPAANIANPSDAVQDKPRSKAHAGHSENTAAVAKIFKAHAELGAALALFTTRARAACPGLSERDLHRAATNAWPCLCLQILHGHPVDPHDAIVGFSLLYPLTDDILDSGAYSDRDRIDFANRFRRRISYGGQPEARSGCCSYTGLEAVDKPQGTRERRIWAAFAMIEKRWPRKHHPALYRALTALWQYQMDSNVQLYGMKHNRQPTLPQWDDIWRITMLKGSFSILCDFYIVNGGTTPPHLFGRKSHRFQKSKSDKKKRGCSVNPLSVSFAAHFGLYTQWLNDLDGLESDIQDGQATPFGLIIGSRRTSTASTAGSSRYSLDDDDEPGKLDGIVRACLTHLATTCGADFATSADDKALTAGSRHVSLASSISSGFHRRRRPVSRGQNASEKQKRKMKKAELERRTMLKSMQAFLALKMLMGVAKHRRHFSRDFLKECDRVSPIRMGVLDRLGQLGEAVMASSD